jgi:hypothetical protein
MQFLLLFVHNPEAHTTMTDCHSVVSRVTIVKRCEMCDSFSNYCYQSQIVSANKVFKHQTFNRNYAKAKNLLAFV